MSDRRTIQIPANLDAEGFPVCPACGCNKSEVTHSWKMCGGNRKRRRVCDHCQMPFTTYQTPEQVVTENDTGINSVNDD